MQLNFKSYGQGPALVILHGLFGSLDNWVSHARALENDYSVYLIDLRNHGKSPHSPIHNYSVMADDIAEFMDNEGILSCALIGHSMGGKVAMEFAGRYPDRVDKLIVADMGLKEYPPHHTEVMAALHNMNLSEIHSRKEAESYLLAALQDNSTAQFLLKGLGRDENNHFEWKFNFKTIDANYDNILAAVHPYPFDKPTLFLYGGNSGYVKEEDFEDIRFYFPNVIFQEMKGAGHWIHAENPALFLENVKTFLSN